MLLRPFLNDATPAFPDALLAEIRPPPAAQERIVAANRAGGAGAAA